MNFMGWITDAAQQALDAIQEPHVERKRYTVQRVAWVMTTGIMLNGELSFAEDAVFKVRDTQGKRDRQLCARSVWYRSETGWKFLPDVAAALSACLAAARAWKAATVERAQIAAWEKMQLLLAEKAPDAIVNGLTGLIEDKTVRGDHRLAAVDRLTQFSFPDLAARIPGERAALMEVQGLDALIDAELARVAGHGESRVADPVADQSHEFPGLSDEAG